ncbi:MAG: glycosyltransferase [Spirochaetaceae bacterium]|jgi:UDP:flavonoid glycosyltransferase YjiC (YdhE family)|nr:glycosyltransferase [Spirochaetaceae bacterium]GMO20095.1 MAG: glycosyltransferase [Termitinemataceae bacterium]
MKILLVTRGSQGDIYPYLPLAKALEARGHEIMLHIPQIFEKFALELSIPYTLQGHDDIIAMLENSPNTKDLLEWMRRVIDQQFMELVPLLEKYDVLVASNTEFAAPSIAEYLKKLYIRTAYAPLMPSRIIPPPVFPFPKPNPVIRPVLLWKSLNTGLNMVVRSTLNKNRKRLGMSLIRDQGQHAPFNAFNLNLYSPALGETDPGWPYKWAQAGYCFNDLLPYDAAVCEKLIAFIKKDERPVLFFTMGSMIGDVRERICVLLYEICEKHDWKFIVGSGWSGLGKSLHDEERLFILNQVIPHKLFLPLCSAIIHHGGAGTTHSAARAGIPQLVVPMIIDQFYWAYRTGVLGLGPGAVKIKNVTKKTLEPKIFDLITNSNYKKNAKLLGEKIRGENGLEKAVDCIESLI